jgi:transcription initiation factor IIE alpha subunit
MKVYFCPKCHRKIPFDKKYIMVTCRRCGEEMFEFVDGNIKNEYKGEVKE